MRVTTSFKASRMPQNTCVVVLRLTCWCFLAAPPLHETIKLLSPLTELEELNLGGNKLGGIIAADVADSIKLKELKLYRMGLAGKICMSQHTCVAFYSC